jgi:hypothetical protein
MSCRLHFQSASDVGGPGHHGHRTSISAISFEVTPKIVYRTHPHIVRGLQAKAEAAVEEVTGDMMRDTAEKFVVHLQRVQEIEGSHIEHMFT